MDTHKVDQHTRTGHEHHPASRPPAADAGGVRHAGRVRHHWHDDSVSRIDPATNRVAGSPILIGAHHAGNLVVGAGDLWVTSDYRVDGAAEDTVVVRIDAQTNRAVETIAVGRPSDRCRPPGVRSGYRWPPAGCCGSPGGR